jgi:PadR family transcriptional regulator, regulatory protein PadR
MKSELLHGTLEVIVLKTLSWGPMHGYGIGRWIEQLSKGALKIDEGSLYPALYRLEKKGWIESEWGLSEKNRRAKYYRLTDEGERELREGQRIWSGFAKAVGQVLTAREQPAT